MTESESLRPPTAAQAVADRLRTEIQRGNLLPGAPLRQNDVAKRYGVSTTPVREAFALLQSDGLVQIDRYRGALVFEPTADDLVEAYGIREALETLAVARAAPRLGEPDIERLEQVIEEMERTADVPRWMELNDAFHLGIYEAAESPRLLAMIASQRDACTQYIRMNVGQTARRREKDAEHREILAGCRAGDVERAQRALRAHLRNTMREVLDLID
jgi:DNA-binding GntR family transcriptional regulator